MLGLFNVIYGSFFGESEYLCSAIRFRFDRSALFQHQYLIETHSGSTVYESSGPAVGWVRFLVF